MIPEYLHNNPFNVKAVIKKLLCEHIQNFLQGCFFTPDKINLPIRRTNMDLWLEVKVAFST